MEKRFIEFMLLMIISLTSCDSTKDAYVTENDFWLEWGKEIQIEGTKKVKSTMRLNYQFPSGYNAYKEWKFQPEQGMITITHGDNILYTPKTTGLLHIRVSGRNVDGVVLHCDNWVNIGK